MSAEAATLIDQTRTGGDEADGHLRVLVVPTRSGVPNSSSARRRRPERLHGG